MNKLKKISTFGLLFAMMFFLAACSDSDDNNVEPQVQPTEKSIVEIATSDDNFYSPPGAGRSV